MAGLIEENRTGAGRALIDCQDVAWPSHLGLARAEGLHGHGEIEQGFVAPGPADEGQSSRASLDLGGGNADLRQAGVTGNAGQGHGVGPEKF